MKMRLRINGPIAAATVHIKVLFIVLGASHLFSTSLPIYPFDTTSALHLLLSLYYQQQLFGPIGIFNISTGGMLPD